MKTLNLIIVLTLLLILDTYAQKKNPAMNVIKTLHNNAVIAEPTYLLGKKTNYTTVIVSANEVDEWLENYNKSEKKDFVIYKKIEQNLLLIPKNLISYFEEHEIRLKKEEDKALIAEQEKLKAEQERRDLEEVLLMNKIAEKPNNLELWKTYLNKYSNPKGKLYDVNIEYGEDIFFEEFLRGSHNSFKTFFKYFDKSNRCHILKNYNVINGFWEEATKNFDVNDLEHGEVYRTFYWNLSDSRTYRECIEQQTQLEQFIIKLKTWHESKIAASDTTEEIVNQIFDNFLKKANQIILYNKEELSFKKKYENKYSDLQIGEKRCIFKTFTKWEALNGYTNERNVQIRLDVSIIDINKNTSEILIKFGDVFNLPDGVYEENSSVSFKRIIPIKNRIEWIHPSDFHLELCTVDSRFRKK